MSVTLQPKPKIPGFISLLLVVALGISLAKLMWLVITPEQTYKTLIQNSGDINNAVKNKLDYGKLIADQHLFGVIKKEPVAIAAPIKTNKKPAAQTKKLNLKLVGIIAYKSKDGLALISSNSGPQKVYGKGDALDENGVKVNEIFPNKVLIDNNGTIQELFLPKSGTKNPRNTAKKSHQAKPNNPTQVSKARTTARINKINSQSPDISGFRKQVMADPRKLMEIAQATPAIINGEFKGFRLQPGRKRMFFRKLGFQPNDILTEVNGIIVDSPSKGAMILGELAQASELSVTVIRGGKDVHIQHSF